MESIFFPATSPTRETRVASLVSALDTAAHLLTTPPVMYIVLPLELVNVKQWSSQITKAKSELEAAVIAQQQQKRIVQDPSSNDDNASMIEIEAPRRRVSARLAPLIQIEAAEDIRAILRWRAGSTGTVSLMNSFESLFVRLVDPTLLEEPNVSLSTLLSPHQQLFLVVDDVLQPRFTERHPDPREVQQWLPPSAFSLPSSKLPKGRIALHLSYSLVLRLLRDQLTIEVSRQLRRLATELIAKARLPLVLSFCGEWNSSNNVETSLALRAQPDLYALLGSLMFGDAQRTLFAEAKGFLRKGHHHSPIREWVTSWEEMTSRRTRPTQRPPPSAERDGHSSSNGGSTKGRRQKRRREENEDDGSNGAVAPTTVIEPDPCDDLELIEDARCA